MLVGDTYTLINYVSFINYLCYGVTILGLLVLRWRRPALHRPIKVRLEVTRAAFISVEHPRQVWVTMPRRATAFAERRAFHALTVSPHNPRKHVLLIFPVHRQGQRQKSHGLPMTGPGILMLSHERVTEKPPPLYINPEDCLK